MYLFYSQQPRPTPNGFKLIGLADAKTTFTAFINLMISYEGSCFETKGMSLFLHDLIGDSLHERQRSGSRLVFQPPYPGRSSTRDNPDIGACCSKNASRKVLKTNIFL
jgi:hypothetical protein